MQSTKKLGKDEMENTNSAFNEVIDYTLDLYFHERWARKAVTHVKKRNSMSIIPFHV